MTYRYRTCPECGTRHTPGNGRCPVNGCTGRDLALIRGGETSNVSPVTPDATPAVEGDPMPDHQDDAPSMVGIAYVPFRLEWMTHPAGILEDLELDQETGDAWIAAGVPLLEDAELKPSETGLLFGAILYDGTGEARMVGILPVPIRLEAGEVEA